MTANYGTRLLGMFVALCFLTYDCQAFVAKSSHACLPKRPFSDTDARTSLIAPASLSPPLLARRDPNNDDDDNLQSSSLPFLTFAVPAVVIVAFWPLLALLRDTNDPTSGFDVDMFMALQGILDGGNVATMDGGIMELPPLSPAEQLVGAIFGPP
jgi:hypothetical protein